MGLLSRLGRTAGRFGGDAAHAMRWNAPLEHAAVGAVGGGLGGAALNPDDPMAGALAGAAMGAGAMGGVQGLRTIGSGLKGAAEEFGLAPKIAQQLRQMLAQPGGQSKAYQAMSELRNSDPQLADEVMQLMGFAKG